VTARTTEQAEFLLALGEAIRFRRRARDLSQEDVSARCTSSRTYLSRLERGCVNPSIVVLTSVADALGCTTIDLLASAMSLQGKNPRRLPARPNR
jgi:transcriptional regulator with XRE-family HTH domain